MTGEGESQIAQQVRDDKLRHPELVSASQSNEVSKLVGKEVSKNLRNFPLAIKKACHCEDERSEDVAIAKSLNINEITTQSSIARNDNNRPPEHVSGSQMPDKCDVRSRNCVRDDRYSFNFFNTCHRALIARSISRLHKRVAFTLAEVLITLCIIGVVASLTLPSVITKYQKQQTIAQLKKAYSTLDNASRLSQVENGEMRTWDKELYHTNIKKYVETYYLPYINGEKNTNWVNKNYVIRNLNGRILYDYKSSDCKAIKTADGQMFMFHQTNFGQSYLWIFADINGTKGPNRIGRDIFVFDGSDFGSNDKYLVHFWGQFWGRNGLMNDNVTENVQNSRGYGCSKKNKYGFYAGFYCGALIIQDGWKISDDYPW